MHSTALVALVAIVLTGLVCGTLIFTQFGLNPALARVSAEVYVSYHKELSRTADRFMPLGVVGGALACGFLALLHYQTVGFGWGFAGAVAGAIGGGAVAPLTILFNLPINLAMLEADPRKPPASWEEDRARWNRAHVWRTWTSSLAFIALTAGHLAGMG
jgi:uncharacterized membrane protein